MAGSAHETRRTGPVRRPPLYRRASEAATLRDHANTLLAGNGQHRAVIVCGDLNDEEPAATTQILLGPGGSEIGTPGQNRPDKGNAWRLWNTAPPIPTEQRYSRIYRGRRELINHILISHELLQRDFRTGHREWDLSAVGPFIFDRHAYKTSLTNAYRV